jgi:hypothetical protein
MRFMLIQAALAAAVLLGATSAAANPFQWVGATSVAFTGDGNGLGFVGMTTQCRADYGPGARMCKSEEILESDTLDFNAIPAEGCWIRPTFVPGGSSAADMTGLTDPPEGLTCQGWTNVAESGVSLRPNGGFQETSCTLVAPVACCAPTPIPEPQASLSLPIGAVGLAGLSMMRGGA